MSGNGDMGVTAAAELLAFADAAVRRDDKAVLLGRSSIVTVLGEPAMLDAAGVIGGFDGITRVADAAGIPLEPAKAQQIADFRMTLGIDRFQREKT
jgi:hypothetical protein